MNATQYRAYGGFVDCRVAKSRLDSGPSNCDETLLGSFKGPLRPSAYTSLAPIASLAWVFRYASDQFVHS